MNERGRPPATVTGPVLQALAYLRHATPPQIVDYLDGRFSLKQVRKALSNGIANQIIRGTGFVRQKGVKGGALMATYWLACDTPPEGYDDPKAEEVEDERLWKPNRRFRGSVSAFPSVWHYAEGRGVRLTWGAANESRARRAA